MDGEPRHRTSSADSASSRKSSASVHSPYDRPGFYSPSNSQGQPFQKPPAGRHVREYSDPEKLGLIAWQVPPDHLRSPSPSPNPYMFPTFNSPNGYPVVSETPEIQHGIRNMNLRPLSPQPHRYIVQYPPNSSNTTSPTFMDKVTNERSDERSPTRAGWIFSVEFLTTPKSISHVHFLIPYSKVPFDDHYMSDPNRRLFLQITRILKLKRTSRISISALFHRI